MSLKSFLPKRLKLFYHRVRWFAGNYETIDEYAKLDASFLYGPITYNTDGLVTCLNCDFIQDTKFKTAYGASAIPKPSPGFTLPLMVYVVCWFCYQGKGLSRGFVACGLDPTAY